MASTNITMTKLQFNEAQSMPVPAAADGTDGALVDYTGKEDGRILLILKNTAASAGTAVVKGGNALQGGGDLEVSLAAGATGIVVLESGKFADSHGPNKGKVLVTGASLQVAAVALP